MWWRRFIPRGPAPSPIPAGAAKWLPVIDTDACTGCGRCIEACVHQCLGMEWSFAVLQRPEACHSDGACRDACPQQNIRMDWVAMPASGSCGRWRDGPSAQTDTQPIPA